MKKSIIIAAAAAFGFGGLIGIVVWFGYGNHAAIANPRPVWSEVQWPFPIDQWGKGKAFHCRASDCGAEVNLYLRAKLGFCNCTTGVADDEEAARLSDFDLMGRQVDPLGEGHPITVAWMKGRSRAFTISEPVRGGDKSSLSVAFNDRCDAMVATVVLGHNRPTLIEPGVIEFLNGKSVLRWAEISLGL
jgi:hypothetical protein